MSGRSCVENASISFGGEPRRIGGTGVVDAGDVGRSGDMGGTLQ